MPEGAIPIKKAIPIIALTWILSLATTLALVYFAPDIFPIKTNQITDNAITADKIADIAIITTKLANGSVTSAKILDGTITAIDLADGSIITIKIANGSITTEKIANGSITNLKLAPYAIPFNSTHKTAETSTTETANWVDMYGTSVTLTLQRPSHLLIMFSTEAYNENTSQRIWIRSMVNNEEAYPGHIFLTPTISENNNHTHVNDISAYSYNFYEPILNAGTYTIKIQWRVTGGTGRAFFRTLTAIALPE